MGAEGGTGAGRGGADTGGKPLHDRPDATSRPGRPSPPPPPCGFQQAQFADAWSPSGEQPPPCPGRTPAVGASLGRLARRLCGSEAGGCGLASQAKAQGPGASSAVDPRVRADPPCADSSPARLGGVSHRRSAPPPASTSPRRLRARRHQPAGSASKCERPGLAGAPPSLGRPRLVSFYHVDSVPRGSGSGRRIPSMLSGSPTGPGAWGECVHGGWQCSARCVPALHPASANPSVLGGKVRGRHYWGHTVATCNIS